MTDELTDPAEEAALRLAALEMRRAAHAWFFPDAHRDDADKPLAPPPAPPDPVPPPEPVASPKPEPRPRRRTRRSIPPAPPRRRARTCTFRRGRVRHRQLHGLTGPRCRARRGPLGRDRVCRKQPRGRRPVG
ncbi:MAG: hypothetical protein R3B70_41350 [Polyangiaceae bacterium]